MRQAMSEAKRTTVVIGAGIVGLTVALELQAAGHHVVVVDPGSPGGRQSASYGHGAWINPASVMPTSLPGLWKQVPGMMRDPVGPFYISRLDMVRLLPWLLRFLWAGSSWTKVETFARQRFELCKGAVEHHAALAEAAGASGMLRREGLVTVFRSREIFARGKKDAAIRESLGIQLGELDAEALRAREPDLADGYTFASVVKDGAYLADTAGYCRALAALLASRGGEVINGRALDFEFDGDRLAAVRTDNSRIDCDTAVLAAGAHSLPLARKVGDRVSMASERGYHVQITGAAAGPRHSLILSDGKVAISPQPGGFRVAGQVELAPIDKAPNWRRADIMLHHAKRGIPALDLGLPEVRIDRWMGHRPSTPDGLPVVGYSSRSRHVIHAFGHGHAGPTMAPATARAVAALAQGRTPAIDLKPCSPRRFRWFNRA
jgi:D-amino-acid dehydrogenase